MAYAKYSDSANRNKADLILADKAWERVKARDSSLFEKATAYAVTNAMKLKAKLGAGCLGRRKKKKKAAKPKVGGGIRKRPRKTGGRKKKRTVARVIPLPATGGNVRSVLTRIGLAPRSVGPAVKKIKAVMGRRKNVKIGRGLYLRPYKTGYGLYLRPYNPLN